MDAVVRQVYELRGIVQGVGFRPTVYRLATAAGLGGWIQNRAGTVRLALDGKADDIAAFVASLAAHLPANARLDDVAMVENLSLPPGDRAPFRILASGHPDAADIVIPADLRMCADCERELLDPADRRHGYPSTTCTHCGPRYTVVTAMPYDRERTTLAAFPLCARCRAEYDDPANRRFHAESIACPACGPRVWYRAPHGGETVQGEALRAARAALADGMTVAVRGLGGYLLAVNAFDRAALARLRARKQRPHKPFAVMARNPDVVRRWCDASDEALALLASAEAPIVILDIRPASLAAHELPLDLLSPDTLTLGVMLPTTPLHRLLADPLPGDPVPAFDLLVMTSGNRRGEPIALTNDEAAGRLAGIADGWLMHNREIVLRNDDSVCVSRHGGPRLWRRARGYAPDPIALPWPLRRVTLALGADMKNAVALGYGDRVVLSPHVGDLDTPEAVDAQEQAARLLPRFLEKVPDVVAIDAHPDMRSAELGRRLAQEAGVPVATVQHHHAHAAACLAEHGFREGLAIVMDGTGWGDDGTFWGAELLDVREDGFRRLATFAPVPLPGGEAAIRRPVRQLAARWAAAGVAVPPEWRRRLGITDDEAAAWTRQTQQGLNAPLSRAAGRLFDAMAALLGVAPAEATYEGQPAIRLEALARLCPDSAAPDVPFEVREESGMAVIDWAPTFRLLADPAHVDGRQAAWAMGFHKCLADAIWRMIGHARQTREVRRIGLSGGVFMNRILTDRVAARLEAAGIEACMHSRVPPGDGGIALGQVVVAGG